MISEEFMQCWFQTSNVELLQNKDTIWLAIKQVPIAIVEEDDDGNQVYAQEHCS